jgi:L-alanine-DL-glutamate epimerase-like enolase superfamily enzyme
LFVKITRVEPIHLRLPEVNERCDGSQETLLVRVHTDVGISGVGEVDSSALVAKAIIEAPLSHKICRGLAECVLGENPLEIERLVHRMYEGTIYFGRQGAVIQAMSGVEIALWDIAGKAAQQPVWRLLGGAFRQKLRAYASILFGETPAETERLGRMLVAQGYQAVKFGWGPMGQGEASDLAQVRAARQGLGDAVELMVDAGLCWDTAVPGNSRRSTSPGWKNRFIRIISRATHGSARKVQSASPQARKFAMSRNSSR